MVGWNEDNVNDDEITVMANGACILIVAGFLLVIFAAVLWVC